MPYHINPKTGVPGLCHAQRGRCPFGDSSKHCDTPQQAVEALEESFESEPDFKATQSVTRKYRRTDVHSPVNLDTATYDYVGSGWRYDGLKGSVPTREIQLFLKEGYKFRDVHGSGQCSHCGAHLNYYAIMAHRPTKTLIHVGETCLANRFDRATNDFQAMRKKASDERQEQKVKKKRDQWLADPRHEELYNWAVERVVDNMADEWVERFANQVKRNGEVSAKFVDSMARARERAVVRDQENLDRLQAENERIARAEPVPTLRGTIRGRVVSTKSKEGYYGNSTLKMLVEDERGFRVWGTVPEDLYDGQKLAGRKIEFTATTNPSNDDPLFGFFKSPRKAIFLEDDGAAAP